MKKYFIMSDIHSQYDLLFNALSNTAFDLKKPEHIVMIDGDILDRGNDGDKVIRFLEKLISKNRLIGVMGNHDKFLVDILEGEIILKTIQWNILHNGFKKTLELGCEHGVLEEEYDIDTIDKIKTSILEKYPIFCKWLMSLPLFREYKYHVGVHGFLDFNLDDWRDTDQKTCIWSRGYNKEIPDTFKKKLIMGHTPNYHINKQDDIIFTEKKVMIDGGAAALRQINIYCLNEDKL